MNQPSEACDDGNKRSGDGCDSQCQIEEPDGWIIDVGYSSRGQVEAEKSETLIPLSQDVSGQGAKIQVSRGLLTGAIAFHSHAYSEDVPGGFENGAVVEEGKEELIGSEFYLALGVGKLFSFDSFQIHPRAQVGFFKRELEVLLGGETRVHEGSGLGLGVGAALRYQLNDRFLVFGDIDFWNDAATTERDGNTHSDGDTTRFGLGLSFTL